MKKTTILAALAVVAMLAFLGGCKSSDDDFSILGNWTINMTYAGNYVYSGGTITFSGSESSGSIQVRFPPDPQIGTGTYTVDDTSVQFVIYWPDAGYTDTCIGTVVNDSSMNGTLVEQPGSTSGTWNCSR